MLLIDHTTHDNHGSTLGTHTDDFENNAWTYTKPYSGQVKEAFGLLGISIDTGYIAANICGFT